MAPRIAPFGRRWSLLTALGVSLALAACSGATGSSASASVAAEMSMGPISIAPAPSHSGPVRCAVTADASPSATISVTKDSLGFFNWSDPVTIKAGQAVAFVNPNGSPHTVTEGANGQAVTHACVDAPLDNNATLSVTFYLPGTYQITCRPHAPMQTSVVVQ